MRRSHSIAGLSIAIVLVTGVILAWIVGLRLPGATEVWEPVPPIVEPGPAKPVQPPPDAIALFDGDDLDEWASMDGSPAPWTVNGGTLIVKKGTGNIRTRRKFRDYRLHLEWRIPKDITGDGQARGNSGLFLGATGKQDAGYELQILDSYQNKTYGNGQAGAVYKQYSPLANPMRPPGEWQSYDVIWKAPRFGRGGALASPAVVTAYMNGVLIQNGVKLRGETVWVGKPRYRAHGRLPIMLQDHRDPSPPISFRNIWVQEM
ncbi:MAG: DUF1080 domain-containing protein [Novosphingobium sp.]|nr:DUF1080 domain-containing protein [Novosphingobium sp.]MCP5400836.1 DUF1080 domain-containing protein [Novosphingobium sp.]